MFGKSFRLSLLLIVMLEALSFWGFLFPDFSTIAAAVVCGLVFILAFIRFDLAVAALLTELAIGSQGGYHLSFGLESGLNLSLRMGLFLAVFLVWAINSALGLLRQRQGQGTSPWLNWYRLMREQRLWWPYLALLAVFLWAGIRGLALNGFSDAFFDGNGYAYFLIVPAIVQAFSERSMYSLSAGVLLAGASATVLKALFVFYVFAHRMAVASPLYIWIRDSRVGEITIMVGDFYRIFFQAHLFGLLIALVLAAVAALSVDWRSRRYQACLAITAWLGVALVLGLSRSFWFGAFFGGLTIMAVLGWSKASVMAWRRLLGLVGAALVVSVAIIAGVYALPWPDKSADFSLTFLLGNRATSLTDSAATSRWALLPRLNEAGARHPLLGSGFGARVEYQTSDPRILADSPTGLYSTYAFEWGYHDLWIKLGLIGLAAYAWLLYRIIEPLARLVRRNRDRFRRSSQQPISLEPAIGLGLLAATIALLFTNIFSPYLNHPLGIGVLALLIAWNARPRSVSESA